MYVIETMMQDGPHWYGGIRMQKKGDVQVAGPEWTPYFEDAKRFSTKAEARQVHKKILKKMEGVEVVMCGKSSLTCDSRWEDGKGGYYMRLKYATPGVQIAFKQVSSTLTMVRIEDDMMVFSESGKEVLMLPKTSDTWVKIIGKSQIETNAENNN